MATRIEINHVLLVRSRDNTGHFAAVKSFESEIEGVGQVPGPALVVLYLGYDSDDHGVLLGVADDGVVVEDRADLYGGPEPDLVDERNDDPRSATVTRKVVHHCKSVTENDLKKK